MSWRDCWFLRRSAVRLFGQGPRVLAPGDPATVGAELLRSDQPPPFNAPACREVTANLPACVADWPLASHMPAAGQVWRLHEAALYDDDGVIYHRPTRRALRETLVYWKIPPHRHPALGLPRVLPARNLPGITLFLGGLGGQTFYHFLVENLPKLALLQPWLATAERILVQNYLEPIKLAWLHRIGVTLPVEWLAPLDHIHCETLLFCTPLVDDCRPSPRIVATLRQLLGVPVVPPAPRSRRIWATRINHAARPAPWEKNLVEHLPAGWEVIDLARLSPDELLALGREVAVFAGLHGAAFANLALFPSGVRVLEIYTRPHEAWYPCLSLSAGHHHEVAFADSAASIPALAQRLAHLSTIKTPSAS